MKDVQTSMKDVQSSIAEVKTTIEAAMQRQTDEGLLPHLIDTLQAIEVKATISKNGVKKHLESFDQRISGLASDISTLKEELVMRVPKPDQAKTTAESISTLRQEVSAHGAKLDRAITIVETQQKMMKTLLELVQKGSVEVKDDIVRLRTHFNGVADRIAFVDSTSSANATATTTGPLITDSSHSHHISALSDTPMEVDVSSLSDPLPSATFPLSTETPAILHSSVTCDQSNTPTPDTTAMITDAPSADHSTVTTAIVEESRSANIIASAQPQSLSADTVDAVQHRAAKGTFPDVVSATAAVITTELKNTDDTQRAAADSEMDPATLRKTQLASSRNLSLPLHPTSHLPNGVSQVPTDAGKASSPDMVSDTAVVLENALQNTHDTQDVAGMRVAADTEDSIIKENVDQDIRSDACGE